MKELIILALRAGVCFGIYPLLLSKSLLPGKMQSAAFCFAVTCFVTPFAISEAPSLMKANWPMLVGAAVASAIGMLSMTGFLAKATDESKGTLILVMIITQTVITVMYQVVTDKSYSWSKLVGLLLAPLVIYLLCRK